MRAEVAGIDVKRAKLRAVHRSGKRPLTIRAGDAVLRGESEVVGYVVAAEATALPQFYWLYEISCEVLNPAGVLLGEELEVSGDINVSDSAGREADTAAAEP